MGEKSRRLYDATVSMTPSFDEKDCVRRALQGDREGFRALVEAYQGRIFRLVLQVIHSREDAEDIVQESFVKAYLSLNTFKGQSSFYTWLYRIAYNMAIDYQRRSSRRGGAPVELDEVHQTVTPADPGNIDGPQDMLVRKEQAARISKVMGELSEDHRVVITLREIDGLSYDEIAEVTGVSKGTVMSRLHYARKKMQDALRDYAPPGMNVESDSLEEENSPSGAPLRAYVK